MEAVVLDEVHRTGIAERTIISSFDAGIVRRVGELDQDITRFFLTERWNSGAIRAFERSRAGGVCLRVDAATPENLEAIRDLDVPVIVWTVNDPERIRFLLEAGVAGIITDDPAAGVRVRKDYMGAAG